MAHGEPNAPLNSSAMAATGGLSCNASIIALNASDRNSAPNIIRQECHPSGSCLLLILKPIIRCLIIFNVVKGIMFNQI
jgi:hypothetical protein